MKFMVLIANFQKNSSNKLVIFLLSLILVSCLLNYNQILSLQTIHKNNTHKPLLEANVFLEIAVTTICACIDEITNWEYLNGNNCGIYDKRYDYVHPIKLSSLKNREMIDKTFKN